LDEVLLVVLSWVTDGSCVSLDEGLLVVLLWHDASALNEIFIRVLGLIADWGSGGGERGRAGSVGHDALA